MHLTLLHPRFAEVGGAEVLVMRHLALWRGCGRQVRLVTGTFDRARWQPWLDGVPAGGASGVCEADVCVLARRWWERHVDRGPARRLRRAAIRLAPHVAGADCVVAYNAPGPAVLGTLRPGARTVWHCNEPERRLHIPDTLPTAVAALRGRRPSAPSLALAWTAEQLAGWVRRMGRPRFVAERRLDVERVARLDRVLAISEFTRGLVRQVYGRDADVVVPPVVPEPARVPRRAGIDRAGGGLHVLAHSRLEDVKNLDHVLRGFAEFRRRVPGAHVLHVVGEGGAAARLRAVGAELALGDAVRWHGYLDAGALAAVYARCDVLAVTPLDEPFGMVFPEAALQGLLLVGPDHGGPLEILDGGALGWAVPPFDADALAEALAEVWALGDGEATRRRAAAAEACRARYGPAAVFPRLRAAVLG